MCVIRLSRVEAYVRLAFLSELKFIEFKNGQNLCTLRYRKSSPFPFHLP